MEKPFLTFLFLSSQKCLEEEETPKIKLTPNTLFFFFFHNKIKSHLTSHAQERTPLKDGIKKGLGPT